MTLLNRDRARWLSEKKHPLTMLEVLDLQTQLKAAMHEVVNLESALRLHASTQTAMLVPKGFVDEGG